MAQETDEFTERTPNRHNERRKEMGLTWVEYLSQEAPDTDYVTADEVREIVREENRKLLDEFAGGNDTR